VLRIHDEIAGEPITFHYVQYTKDIAEFKSWVLGHDWLAWDTESTGLNCYHPQWKLRTVQCGDRTDSYVIPARYVNTLRWLFTAVSMKWIAHNGPHDVRSVDQHLRYATGLQCAGETYIPSHHLDSRNQQEGGIGHGLKELACNLVDREAGKWEKALKNEFKQIMVDVPGEVYKSGKRKGEQKVRRAKLSEGYALIGDTNPVYIAYSASDTILTYRLWEKLNPTVRSNLELYRFDLRVQQACSKLQERGFLLDTGYTKRLRSALFVRAGNAADVAREFGCGNIYSTQQLARTLSDLGIQLTERTRTGQYKVDDGIMRGLLHESTDNEVKVFIRSVLLAKQLTKRREAYCEQMLSERDVNNRVHPGINPLAARTSRMSVSSPALQQLPTKDHGDDEE
jgi:DNA polymerase-1